MRMMKPLPTDEQGMNLDASPVFYWQNPQM